MKTTWEMRMDDAWLGLAVEVLVVLTLVGALVYDRRRPSGGVSEEALRRARELDTRHQSPGPPAGSTFP